MARLRFPLALKLAAGAVGSFLVFLAAFSYLSLREHRRHSEELVLQSADRISDVILRATRYQMLHNDREALYYTVTAIGTEPGLRVVRIFNEEGRISFSTDPKEINTAVDKAAEACYRCHAEAAPLVRLERPDRARIFTAEGRRVLGIIRPIENQPACWTAACHAHPPERRILGVIDVNLWLNDVDRQLAEYRSHLVGLTALWVLAASAASVWFIVLVVHRPVKELIAGTKQVARGDLAHRLPVRSRDELGELAASFNQMTADLERARQEITAWARTLEQRVAIKTQQLQQAQNRLIASEKMASLGKLAAVVAHEVNNPLFGILTYARLVLKALEQDHLDGPAKAAVVEQLRIIERESHRCGEIVKNLLSFARQAPPRKEPRDLNTLVRQTLALVRHQLDLQQIQTSEQLAAGLPECCCDGQQIQQALLALLVNAAEAMPQGGQLTVVTERDPDAPVVRIRVRDTGGGIPPDVLPHIFEPFFTTKENQRRTGLGLTVARKIIEDHGGSLDVNSSPGQGAEFIIRLPLTPTPALQEVSA
ncbi:MAG: ATP-binding protein [Bryobacteraceae bacterium]|nr:ATP-binding protein [Bryobacteraceae bacterium]